MCFNSDHQGVDYRFGNESPPFHREKARYLKAQGYCPDACSFFTRNGSKQQVNVFCFGGSSPWQTAHEGVGLIVEINQVACAFATIDLLFNPEF